MSCPTRQKGSQRVAQLWLVELLCGIRTLSANVFFRVRTMSCYEADETRELDSSEIESQGGEFDGKRGSRKPARFPRNPL